MKKNIKIGLITTLNTNIGDDLIREGICLALGDAFNDSHLEFVPINKHEPMTVYPAWHPVHWTKNLPSKRHLKYHVANFVGKGTYQLGFSYFDDCDLIVQCGAPVLWENCHQSEWAELLWHQVIKRLHQSIPTLNLAAGSCYPWERQPDQITETKDAKYLSDIGSYCRITTVRDHLAHELLAGLGVDSQLMPCSAFLSAGDLIGDIKESKPILINYMKGGGHFDWEQQIDITRWETTVRQLIATLKKQHNLVLLCHDEKEYKLAEELDPTIKRVWPKTPKEYFETIQSAKLGICNRMHASVALSSLGIPSIAICTDTRLLMLKEIGVKHAYVKDATFEYLIESVNCLMKSSKQEQERLIALRRNTRKRYIEVIKAAVSDQVQVAESERVAAFSH